MKNIVTTQEIIYAFAKLQLWFDLSPLYRLNGFFDGVDEMIDYFNNVSAAYMFVLDRVATAPEKLKVSEAKFHKGHYPENYDGTIEDWIEERSQISDLFFCIAVCRLACLSHDEVATKFEKHLKDKKMSKSALARLKAVLSTMDDLRVDELFASAS